MLVLLITKVRLSMVSLATDAQIIFETLSALRASINKSIFIF